MGFWINNAVFPIYVFALLFVLKPKAAAQEKAFVLGHEDQLVQHVEISSDGKALVSSGADRAVRLWELPRLEPGVVFRFHPRTWPTWPFFDPSEKIVFFCTYDGRFRGWKLHRYDLQSQKQDVLMESRDPEIVAAVFPKLRKIAAAGVETRFGKRAYTGVRVIDITTGKDRRLGFRSEIRKLIFSSDAAWVALEDGEKRARVLDLESGKTVVSLPLNLKTSRSWCFSPDKKTFVVVDELAKVWFFELPNGKQIRKERIHLGADKLAFNADGTVLAIYTLQNISFFDMKTGKVAAKQVVGGARFDVLTFAPDGKTYVTGEYRGELKLFETPRLVD